MSLSAIENFIVIRVKLCTKWADTRNISDSELKEYLAATMMGILATIPNITVGQCLDDLKLKNEAIEELEDLIDLLETNCRHITFGAYRK